MADMINFTLPKIDESDDKQTLKQIKNYLFQLTEQMRYYLNNIDSDNFTEEYYERMSRLVSSETENSKQMDKMQEREYHITKEIADANRKIANTIANNKGGYIFFNDTDGDGLPDELLIMDKPRIEDADKMWRWNLGGLMFNNGGYYPANDSAAAHEMIYNKDTDAYEERKMVVGIDMDGNINASAITTGKITAVDIEGVNVTGVHLSGCDGEIGNWIINDYAISSRGTNTAGDVYRCELRTYGYSTAADAHDHGVITITKNPDTTPSWPLIIRYDGCITAGAWTINEEKIFQRVKTGTVTYESTFKANHSTDYSDKVFYANEFTNNRNSDSPDSDDYRTEFFYIEKSGDAMFNNCSLNGALSAYGGIRANDRHSGKVYVDIDSDLTSGGLPITASKRAIIDSYGGMVVSANRGDSGLILRGSGIFLSTNNITLPTSGTKALGINSNGQIVTI